MDKVIDSLKYLLTKHSLEQNSVSRGWGFKQIQPPHCKNENFKCISVR
jgi:hypothetical protein